MEDSFNKICEELNNIKEKIQWSNVGSADDMLRNYMERCAKLEAKIIFANEELSELRSLHAKRMLEYNKRINDLEKDLINALP